MGGEDELYERYQSDGKIPESMCWKEMAQCGTSTKAQKPKKEKAAPKKQSVPSKKQQGTPQGKVTENHIHKAKSPVMQQVEVNSKAAAVPTDETKVNKTGISGQIDMETYLRSLALEDGLSVDSYSKLRPKQDWDKLIVAMAG